MDFFGLLETVAQDELQHRRDMEYAEVIASTPPVINNGVAYEEGQPASVATASFTLPSWALPAAAGAVVLLLLFKVAA